MKMKKAFEIQAKAINFLNDGSKYNDELINAKKWAGRIVVLSIMLGWNHEIQFVGEIEDTIDSEWFVLLTKNMQQNDPDYVGWYDSLSIIVEDEMGIIIE